MKKPIKKPVKICGLTTPEAVEASVSGGAAYLGLVFAPKSIRCVSVEQAAALAPLAHDVPLVGVFVDPDDTLLEHVLASVPLSLLQLHGRETPERVRAIDARFGLPVIKALSIVDLATASDYTDAAMLLIDGAHPGSGQSYDATPLRAFACDKPWFLAGGLTAGNLAERAQASGARLFDVSSGVESAPSQKDAALIKAFLAAAG